MPDLPVRPNLDQLRNQAKDLLRAARAGERASIVQITSVSDQLTLAAAQLALARTYGFASWPRLKAEVQRRAILDDGDLQQLADLLAAQPNLAADRMEHWCDHPKGANPLGYVAMLRFDAQRRRQRVPINTGAMARALLDAGAPVDGAPDDLETPLITASSYGDAGVARVLLQAGAALEATGPATGGTALHHAAVFGMTDVLDLLAEAGARIASLPEAAAVGDVSGWLTAESPLDDKVRALVMAADHERLNVIDQLVAADTPVDAADQRWGRQPLRVAAQNGRPSTVRRLLKHGADRDIRDPVYRKTPLDWCREQQTAIGDSPRHREVEAILLETAN